MNVKMQPEVEKDTRLRKIVEDIAPILERAVGRSSDRLTATWDAERGADGDPWLRLHLWHPYGEIAAVFQPEQFSDSEKSLWRLRRLWDDLLAEATHRHIQRLEAVLD